MFYNNPLQLKYNKNRDNYIIYTSHDLRHGNHLMFHISNASIYNDPTTKSIKIMLHDK